MDRREQKCSHFFINIKNRKRKEEPDYRKGQTYLALIIDKMCGIVPYIFVEVQVKIKTEDQLDDGDCSGGKNHTSQKRKFIFQAAVY